jgi:hypothetical protein
MYMRYALFWRITQRWEISPWTAWPLKMGQIGCPETTTKRRVMPQKSADLSTVDVHVSYFYEGKGKGHPRTGHEGTEGE